MTSRQITLEADLIGLVLAVALAGTTTAMTVWFATLGWTPWLVLEAVVTMAAWVGAWAWWHRRWALALIVLPLTFLAPWGFFIELSGPVTLLLLCAAGLSLRRERRARRREGVASR